METLTALTIVVFLAACGEALTEFLIVPAWERAGLPKFYLVYVGAVVGGSLVFISGQNLLANYLPATPALVIVGRVLTALLAGRGSNWIHQFFSGQQKRAELAKEQIRAIRTLEED